MVQVTSSIKSKSSIKKTTVTASLVGILLVSIVALIFSNLLIRSWLTTTFDENLVNKLNLLQTLIDYEPPTLDFDFADEFMPEYSRDESPEYLQIWQNDAEVFLKSDSLKEQSIPFKTLSRGEFYTQNILLPDGRKGRVAYIAFIPQLDLEDDEDESTETGEPEIEKSDVEEDDDSEESLASDNTSLGTLDIPLVTIAIARERESLDEVIVNANLLLISSSMVLIILLSLIVWNSIIRGLKPLDNLQSQIEVLDFKQEKAYLGLTNEPQELHTLINRFNRMLDSVREGFSREQQFSSDVAHELKTPISEIRTIAEVALLNNKESNNYTRSLEEIKDVSIQMGDLVNQLLALARSEVQKDGLKRSQIDVEQMIQNTLHAHEDEMREREVSVEVNNNCDPYIHTLSLEFSQIVSNLLSNAIRYCPKGSLVSVNWKNTGIRFSLIVSNVAQDLQSEDLKHIFKRMWKKDQARTDLRHSGIGLSLVKIYCEALDYQVETQLIEDEFSISISGLSHG